MKRTKTAEQINEQWARISKYVRKRGYFMEYFRVYVRYRNRMTGYNGESPYWHDRYHYNKRNNSPVPVSFYAKK